MNKDLFLQLGLTSSQAEILDYLYQVKNSKASIIARKIKRSRAIVYKDLEELLKLDVVEKTEKPKEVATFKIKHPSYLKNLLEEKEALLNKNKDFLRCILPDLIGKYNLISDEPGIKTYEGIEGLKKIYEDILKEKDDLCIFASTFDRVVPELNELIDNQIIKQKKIGIKTRALVDSKDPILNANNSGKNENIELKTLENFSLRTQIILYKNKTAITGLKTDLITVLIENDDISQTFRLLFDLLWKISPIKFPEKEKRSL